MSATISATTGKLYGIQRVCHAWEEPRSSFYGKKERLAKPAITRKRGPKTLLSDDELLTLIRTDLATSRFIGEGHRKVWYRLRFVKGHKIRSAANGSYASCVNIICSLRTGLSKGSP
jgi:hypothetical protein